MKLSVPHIVPKAHFTHKVRFTCEAYFTFRASGTLSSKNAPLSADKSAFFVGLPERIRTFDLQSRSLTRYPAVPRVDIFFFAANKHPFGDRVCLPRFIISHFPLDCKHFLTKTFLFAFFGGSTPFYFSSVRGSVTVKVLPCPLVLCTAMLPPHRVAARCAMVSPMPYPLL